MSSLSLQGPLPIGSGVRVPSHPPIIPTGYTLTTRLMRDRYWHPHFGCPQGAHTHPEHVVFFPILGTDSVEVAGVSRALTVGEGVWVPAGTPHVVLRAPSSTMAAVHIDPSAWPEGSTLIRIVGVRPALRELLIYLMEAAISKEQRLRAQRVCLELLADEGGREFDLVIPQDERIAPIVERLLADPADGRSIEEWAWVASLSSRTVARVFERTTGMSFNAWRMKLRIVRAVEMLISGTPVGVVAGKVGYASIGAFSNAFHRVSGHRPHEFLPPRA